MADFMVSLPQKLLERLTSYLDVRTLLSCCCLSHYCNEAVSSNEIWLRVWKEAGFDVDEKERVFPQHFKRFFLSAKRMTMRKKQMIDSECFATVCHQHAPDKIESIDYYEGKIATGSKGKVQIWDSQTGACLSSIRNMGDNAALKFDDRYVVTVGNGMVVCWPNDGRYHNSNYYWCDSQTPVTIDFHSNYHVLVAGCVNPNQVWVWCMKTFSRTATVGTTSEYDSSVVKVILSPRMEQTRRELVQPFSLLLYNVCLQQHHLLVRKIRRHPTRPTEYDLRTVKRMPRLMTSDDYFGSLYQACSCQYMSDCLYFATEWANKCDSCVVKLQVFTDAECMTRLTCPNVLVRCVLGVGRKYLAVIGFVEKTDKYYFVVLDNEKLEEVARQELPGAMRHREENRLACICERAWLDGLDGLNETGIAFTYISGNSTRYAFRWNRRALLELPPRVELESTA